MTQAKTSVLIVGAGPTGLTLALDLTRRGVPVRIIEKHASPSQLSKALVLQARTLEVLDLLGIADAFASESITIEHIESIRKKKRIFRFNLERPSSKFTRPMVLRQSTSEALLRKALEDAGVLVEFGTALISFAQNEEGVSAIVEDTQGESTIRARYLAGCDGSRSLVRTQLNIPFEGKVYKSDFTQLDATLAWDKDKSGAAMICDDGALLVLPLDEKSVRVIRMRKNVVNDSDPVLEDFQRDLDDNYPSQTALSDPQWCVRFRLEERIAQHYRKGSVFIAGDAAHTHSPAGGQGMNTGMQDAFNLGWKLAYAALENDERYLDSYEAERRPVAARVLRATGRAMKMLLGGPRQLIDVGLIFAPLIATRQAFRRRMSDTVMQLDVNVRSSVLVEDHRSIFRRLFSRLHAGDRIPDIKMRSGHLFEHLRHSPYGLLLKADDLLGTRYPLKRNECLLIRPDGQIGGIGPEERLHLPAKVKTLVGLLSS